MGLRSESLPGLVSNSRGFSLVELIFVAGVSALSLVAGLYMLSYLTDSANKLSHQTSDLEDALSFQNLLSKIKMRVIPGTNLYLKQSVINEVMNGNSATQAWLSLPVGRVVFGGMQVVGSSTAGKKLNIVSGVVDSASLNSSTNPFSVVTLWTLDRGISSKIVQGGAVASALTPDLVNTQRPHDFSAANCSTTACSLFVETTGPGLATSFPNNSFFALSTNAGVQVLKVVDTADSGTVPNYGRIRFSSMSGTYNLGYKTDDLAIDVIARGSLVQPVALIVIGVDGADDSLIIQEIKNSTTQVGFFKGVSRASRIQVLDRTLNQNMLDLTPAGFDLSVYSAKFGLNFIIDRRTTTGDTSPLELNVQL